MVSRIVILEVDGLRIAGELYLPGEGGRAPYPTVCVCHGIPSGNPPVSGDGGYPFLAEKICHVGLGVFIFNFRGTGDSEGSLDIQGWTRDLEGAIGYLYALPEVDGSRLSLLGFSGGAAVSVYVAAHDSRISSVIACACPADFAPVIKVEDSSSIIERFRRIGVIRDKDFPHSAEEWIDGFRLVSPIEYVGQIAPRPLLLVHGGGDETVDVSHAYRLYGRAGEPKQIIVVEGAGHRLRQNDRAMAIIIDWLKSQCLN